MGARWARRASEDELADWMQAELEAGHWADRGAGAWFIKLSAGDDGLTALETKILRAAARAGIASGAAIASHTIRGRVAADQLDVLEAAGYPLERFIWVHAQNESDRIYPPRAWPSAAPGWSLTALAGASRMRFISGSPAPPGGCRFGRPPAC